MAITEKPVEPVSPGAGNEGEKKKIAGKWDTVEQAIEEGYGGLEKGFHAMSENIGKLTKIVEVLATSTPIGTSQRPDSYQRTGQQIEDSEIDPTKFLLNPGKFLQERDDKLARNIVGQVVDLVGNMNAVNQFKADNPDLIKHEKVVQAFMRDQSSSLPINDRLKGAASAAREYLKGLKVDLNAGNSNPAPHGNNYVEAPAGGNRSFTPAVEDEEGEKALIASINQRNKDMTDHFGVVKEK